MLFWEGENDFVVPNVADCVVWKYMCLCCSINMVLQSQINVTSQVSLLAILFIAARAFVGDKYYTR